MYKILIVDDEMLARVGIKSLIPWEDNGFIVEGEAENGKQAYEWLRANPIDIVITDIKMPVMDGIELIRRVREENKEIKFIVLSSFDDFEYVKEALKSGAADYLIKLQVRPEQLLEQLKKLTTEIEQERSANGSDRVLGNGGKEISLIRETLFRDLLYGWIRTNEEYRQRLKEIKLELPEGLVVCLMFRTEDMEIYNRYKDEEIHLLNFAILNMLNEIIAEYKWTYAIASQTREFVIIQHYDERTDAEEALVRAGRLAAAIRHSLNQYLNLSIAIGVSEAVLTFNEMNRAYKQLHEIFSSPSPLLEGGTIHYRDVRRLQVNTNAPDLTKHIHQLESALKLYEDTNVIKELDTIKQIIKKSTSIPLEILKGYCSTIIYVLSSRRKENTAQWMEHHLKWVDKMKRKSDFLNWLTSLQTEWENEYKGLSENSRLIASAQRYIQTNYAKEISLESVAEYLNLSPSYLSNLFKKETGGNFIDYLTKTRIDQAKVYLRTEDYKIYRVGQMVGYENEHYFSRVFKKVTGFSPLQYKSDTGL